MFGEKEKVGWDWTNFSEAGTRGNVRGPRIF